MLATSLTTHSTVDNELFPLLNVQCCVSEARESRNGPRFSAQDVVTGSVYEVRCRLIASGTENAARKNALLAAQARINELMAASAQSGVQTAARNVLLPVDVYIQEQPSTGAAYVVSVEPFAGLSLGDIVRSGWTLVDENTFLDILQAAEEFGKASRSLPPHGNLSTDSLKQVLMVRDGATETNCPSRWVVADWLLTPDPDAFAAERNSDQLLQDLEWLLHSCFSMLNVTAAQDGAFLTAGEVEDAINAMIDRVRHHLATVSASSVKTRDGGERGRAGEGMRGMRISARALLDETAGLSVQEKIAHHQNALRSEQVVVQRSRRKRGQLPPLAQHGAGGAGSPLRPLASGGGLPPMPDQASTTLSSTTTTARTAANTATAGVANGADVYELHYLSSPIVVKTSQLLTLQSAATAPATAAKTSPDRAEPTRDAALDSVVDLAVRARERSDEYYRKREAQQRKQRDALRAALPGSATKVDVPTSAVVAETPGVSPATQKEHSQTRRGGGALPAAEHSARGAGSRATAGGLMSARRASAPASHAPAPATATVASKTAPPADKEAAPEALAGMAKVTTARARSASASASARGPSATVAHEQSPEPRPPTPFSKPIFTSPKPAAKPSRFGLAVQHPKTHTQGWATSGTTLGVIRRPIATPLADRRTSAQGQVRPATSKLTAPSPTPAQNSPATSRRASGKATTQSGVPAQRVEMLREPHRLVPPGRGGAAEAIAEPAAASAHPLVTPLPLHKLLQQPSGADDVVAKSGRRTPADGRSPRAQTARPQQTNSPRDTHKVLSPRHERPQTARDRPASRGHRHSPRHSPRTHSPRERVCGTAGAPPQPRQAWNGSPRVEPTKKSKTATPRGSGGHITAAKVAGASGAHPHPLGSTPRGASGSPKTGDRHRASGSPRLSGSAPGNVQRSTSRAHVRDADAPPAKSSRPKPQSVTRPVTAQARHTTVSRQPRRVSDPEGSTDHLSKGTVYPVNETSVGIGLRLARMQSGPQ